MRVLDKAPMEENVSWEGGSGDRGGDMGSDPGSGWLAEWRKQRQEVCVLRSICVDVGAAESQARVDDRQQAPRVLGVVGR